MGQFHGITMMIVVNNNKSFLRVSFQDSVMHYTGWPKKLSIFQHTISLEPFKIK